MSISSNIRKILFISFWCVIGAGILVLLIAAMRVKKEKICSGYSIDIKSASPDYFLDKKDDLPFPLSYSEKVNFHYARL